MSTTKETRQIFEIYASAWHAPTREAMRAALEASLDPDFRYRDPQTKRRGHEQMIDAILELQARVPGVHFQVTYFLAYEDRALARWNTLGPNEELLGEGADFCELGADGKLTTITGFFEVPSTTKEP